MSTTSGQLFLMECEHCGMKINSQAKQIGGDSLCQHSMKQYNNSSQPVIKQKRAIVYPTDAENHWLRIMDQNQVENSKHSDRFGVDVKKLSELKSQALDDIKSKINSLQNQLEKRSIILQNDLKEAFEERQSEIFSSIKSLQGHKKRNEETKEQSEELLLGSMPQKEREKKIVTECAKIITDTPQLKYIPTELRYTFDSLEYIEKRIKEFGILKTKKIDSGPNCEFKSTQQSDKLPQVGPKTINLPDVALKSSSYDDKSGRAKLVFKINDNDNNSDMKITDHLSIHAVSVEYDDDDMKEDQVDWDTPTHQEDIKLSECQKKGNNKYELLLKHRYTPGTTVSFRMRAIFKSPDTNKYKNTSGAWCKAQSIDVVEDTEVEYKLILNGRTKILSLKDDDPLIKNYEQFAARFVQQFSYNISPNEILILTATSNNPSDKNCILSSTCNLAKYTSNANLKSVWTINGVLQSIKPAEPQSIKKPISNSNAKQKSSSKSIKKQMSIIVIFNTQKKRVNLKYSKKTDTNEYTIQDLKRKVLAKYNKKDNLLQGPFSLEMDGGDKIQQDDDVAIKLHDFNGGQLKLHVKKTT